MKLEDLKDGQTVRARWGRAGDTDVKWGAWKDVQLFVQTSVEKKSRQPKIAIVALKDVNWAEYGVGDFTPAKDAYQNGVRGASNGIFLTEDYYLEIDGLQ